jgi:DNA-binding NtrC family response regulator
VAREIHRLSRRAAGPLVHVACGVLREAELNEKLFGERAGSFSAETPSLSSLLQSSSQGTLFLEEVSELPLWAQVKLLDCLQPSTSLSREGGSSNSAGVRVIAATTCDPATAMAGNTCYPGLYYYLNVVQIRIPPLRYRQEDIRALGEHFLAAANSRQGSPSHAVPQRLSQEAWQTLLGYDWPGNVLQLASVIARAVTLADGPEIGQEQMAACLGEVQPHSPAELISVPLAGGLKEMEHAIIHEVLRRCRGNKAAAARSLRLHRRTLYRLLGK